MPRDAQQTISVYTYLSDEEKLWFCLLATKKALGKGGHHLAPFYPSTHTERSVRTKLHGGRRLIEITTG